MFQPWVAEPVRTSVTREMPLLPDQSAKKVSPTCTDAGAFASVGRAARTPLASNR